MGEGRGRECRGPGWQAGPSCPMTRMPPGWRPLLLPGRGSGWAKPPQVLEGCQALAPAAPPGPTPPGSYCYRIDCPVSLRSTASADSSPLPPVGRDTEGVLGLAVSSHTVREAGSPEFITGRETEGEGGRWKDLRAAGCHLGPPPALSPAPGLEWLRPSWRTRWVQGWLRWQQAEGKVGWEQQGAIVGC